MINIIVGNSLDVLKKTASECVDMVMTSPPYWALRDYGVEGQLGLESTFDEYISNLCDIFNEVKRVLKPEGTCWVNIGDTYAGNKSGFTDTNKNKKIPSGNLVKKSSGTFGVSDKSLVQIPARFAIEMCNRGWILRNEIIWHKPNVMPQSVKDRFTVDFEKLFMFSKNPKYYFNTQYEPLNKVSIDRAKYGWKSKKAHASAKGNSIGIDVVEMGSRFANPKGRNKRAVWKIPTSGSRDNHVAMYPEKLCETPILAGCPIGGIVMDPFTGSGTTGVVAIKNNRDFIGIELNPDYAKMAERKINSVTRMLF